MFQPVNPALHPLRLFQPGEDLFGVRRDLDIAGKFHIRSLDEAPSRAVIYVGCQRVAERPSIANSSALAGAYTARRCATVAADTAGR